VTEIVNLLEGPVAEESRAREGHLFRRSVLGRSFGAELTGFSLYELPPAQAAWAYHYELTREEWLIVVAGEVIVRCPDGDRTLRAGDVLCFPVGEAGAHQVRNDSGVSARFAMPSSAAGCVVAIRPDSRTASISGPGYRGIVSIDEDLEYWDREP
jgi:uncharacterized cupin superfamily protein